MLEAVREKAALPHCQWDCTLVWPLCKSGWQAPNKAKNKYTTGPSYITPWLMPM